MYKLSIPIASIDKLILINNVVSIVFVNKKIHKHYTKFNIILNNNIHEATVDHTLYLDHSDIYFKSQFLINNSILIKNRYGLLDIKDIVFCFDNMKDAINFKIFL